MKTYALNRDGTLRRVDFAAMQKPSIGRIVIVNVVPNFSTNNGSNEAPAIITRVWNDELVNVKVLNDGPENEWKTSVTLHDERPENPGHGAWWPPRV